MDQRVETVIRLIEEDLSRSLPLGGLAAAVNLSPSRLHQIFRNATGISPSKYLKARRLAEAKRLLETTFLSVKEIRLRVGIDDESHFTRDFRGAYGCTPTEYRRHCRPRPAAEPDLPPQSTRAAAPLEEEEPASARPVAEAADAGAGLSMLWLPALATD